MGENWVNGVAYGGSGNDTFIMPATGVAARYYGGDGDDVFETDNSEATPASFNVFVLKAGTGNDKITTLYSTISSKVYGEEGDDKII